MDNHLTIRSRISTGIFFSVILLVLFIQIKTGFNFYDEGFAVFDATRVMHGDIPYRDFWAIYSPGQFYLLALVFKLFGAHLMASRIYDTLVRFAIVVGIYLLTKKVSSPWPARLVSLLAGLLLASIGFYSYAVFPAIGLGLWAILSWSRYPHTRHRRWLILAGILLGIAAMIRWDIGLYTSVSLLAGSYLLFLAHTLKSPANSGSEANVPPGPARRFNVRALFPPFKPLAWLLEPMLAVVFLGYGMLGLQSGWRNLYEQLFYFPATVFHSVRWLAYPPLIPGSFPPPSSWSFFYLPILILSITACSLAYSLLKSFPNLQTKDFAAIVVTLFGAFLFNQALSRYDEIHVLPATLLTLIAASALVARHIRNLQRVRLQYILYVLLGLMAIPYLQFSFRNLLTTMSYTPPWGCYSRLEKASCVLIDKDQQDAVEFIQAHTRPNEPIFVGNQKHDRIFVSDVGFYYLADRPSATRYHELHPGVATTLPVQMEIVRELETKKVTWIVLVNIWDSTEPNGSAVSSGVFYLDDYLRASFTPVTEFGIYRVLRKK